MALVPVSTRNRINPYPLSVADLNSYYVPYDYDHGRHHKHRRHKHHHRHHHRKHKSHFWSGLIPRVESASSAVTIHSVELDERRPIYHTERALVPVDQTERQVVSTTRTRRLADDDYVREAWINDSRPDDEVVCCRAYNGCRCPCWCFIIFIILVVILIIILIVLLATLL